MIRTPGTQTHMPPEWLGELGVRVLEALEDAVTVTRPDGTIVYWNAAATRVFGWTAAEAVGRNVGELAPPELGGPAARELTAELQRGNRASGERILCRKDGTRFLGSVRVSPMAGTAGAPDAVLVVTSVVDSPPVVSHALFEHAEILRAQLEASPDAILVVVDGKVRAANGKLCALLGVKRTEVQETSLEVLRERAVALLADAASAQALCTPLGRARLALRDGRVLDRYATAIERWDGAPIGYVAFLSDATEHERAVEELRRSEARFRSLLEELPHGVAVADDEGRILYANAQLVRMLNAPDVRALHGHIPPGLGEDGAARAKRFVREVIDGGRSGVKRLERAFDVPGRGERIVELQAIPVEYDRRPAILVLARDVTDLRRMEAQLRLSDRLSSVGVLAAGVAHELNNPLSFVLSNLGFALDELREPEMLASAARRAEVLQTLREARDGADRMRLIVRDLASFSGADDQTLAPVDVRHAVRAALKMSDNELRHRAMVEVELADVPPVVANEARLAQVFLNLLMNAAQAIAPGRAATHRIRVQTRLAPDGRMAISVQDTGVGISPELLPRIFDPFFTTRPVGEGTGLGLSVCRNLVRQLDGELQVESREGQGSTFTVLLPAAPQPSEAPEPGTAGEPRTRCARILVIDDEPLLLRSLQRTVGRAHELVTARSGQEALELLESDRQFDGILCDVMMPDVSGPELREQIRALSPQLARRVRFMSAGVFGQDERDGFAGEALLEKPLDPVKLQACLDAWLAEPGGKTDA